MHERIIIAMHACVDRGDGTINLYAGPYGPETEKAIAAIDKWHDGIVEKDPSGRSMEEAEGDIQECTSDEDLAETLLWWANGGAPRSEWEVDTGVSTGIDLD